MFFVLSKILIFLITPLVWIIILLFFSFFSKYPERKKKYLGWAIFFTLLFSNPFIFDECSRLWEIPATRIETLKPYHAGIVLGGMSVCMTRI